MKKEKGLGARIAGLKDVGEVMCSLWEVEEKIKALGVLFKNFNGGGCEIEDAEHLSGLGAILAEASSDLRKVISSLDGRSFARKEES